MTDAPPSDPAPAVIVAVCKTGDVPEGEMRCFDLPGMRPIAIYRVRGEFFATEDRCTHAGASLSRDGTLSEYIVECSLHTGSFDIRSGKGVAAPCRRPLRTYRIAQRDDEICLALTPTQALEAGLVSQ